ncbi:protein PXR1-like [Cryptomeria japonica]|uniref:protein PXR1-like n=1 Tax=Cryptomeria japonica TaxID=3369 RepID=UPI0025AD534E|nr:protein PXR1-like [Cryptomeria japonica]
MGGNRHRYERNNCKEWKQKEEIWSILQKGGLTKYMERLHGRDAKITNFFTKNWRKGTLKMGDQTITIDEDLIAQVMGLRREGNHGSVSDSEEEGSDSKFSMGEDSIGDSKSETEESLEDSYVELGKKRKQESIKSSSSKGKKKSKEKVFQIHSSSSSEVSEDFEKDDPPSPRKKKPKSSFQKRKKQKRQGNSELEMKDKEQRKDSDVDQKFEEENTGDGFNQSVGSDAEQNTSGEDPKTDQAK